MPGIESNAYQLARLVANVKAEASKGPPLSCSWVGPVGDYLACLMSYVVSSHLCDECADISSMCLEPSVVREVKPYETNYEQKE